MIVLHELWKRVLFSCMYRFKLFDITKTERDTKLFSKSSKGSEPLGTMKNERDTKLVSKSS